MISDDASKLGLPELPDFHEHRWDQSLLSLICFKKGLKSIFLGVEEPALDTKHPSKVAKILGGEQGKGTLSGQLVSVIATIIEAIEWFVRIWIKFNKPSVQPKKSRPQILM